MNKSQYLITESGFRLNIVMIDLFDLIGDLEFIFNGKSFAVDYELLVVVVGGFGHEKSVDYVVE